MNTPSLPLPFVLLALSICAVWVPPLISRSNFTTHVWPLLFLAAGAMAIGAGIVTTAGALAIAAFWALLYLATRLDTQVWRWVCMALASALALLLAFHLAPGFKNPILLEKVLITPDALPYTQYANFDKASVGLLLLALVCQRARAAHELLAILQRFYLPAILTLIAVIGLALALGYVRPAIKWPAFTWLFAVVNLLFVCVAEEAFFRGFLQHRLARYLSRKNVPAAVTIAIAVCAVLFGLSHFGGGLGYVTLATVAGIGYGYVYQRTQRIEAPILTHFALNMVHFIGFTYPRIANQ